MLAFVCKLDQATFLTEKLSKPNTLTRENIIAKSLDTLWVFLVVEEANLMNYLNLISQCCQL